MTRKQVVVKNISSNEGDCWAVLIGGREKWCFESEGEARRYQAVERVRLAGAELSRCFARAQVKLAGC